MPLPRCPNHGEELLLDSVQKGQRKGASACPVSGVLFEWEQDIQNTANSIDKYGNPTKTYTVTGTD